MEGITYRWLTGPEACEWLNDTILARGWAELNPNTAMALCAFDGPKIVGFYVIQLFPHAEPMFVAPEFRGTGLADELADQMQKYLQEVRVRGCMIVADNPVVARMCEKRGMKRVTSPVYLRVEDSDGPTGHQSGS